MKKVLVGLFTILISTFSNGQTTDLEIGRNEDEVYNITMNMTELGKIIQDHLKKQKLEIEIAKIEIKKDIVEGTENQEYFMLLAQNEDGSVKFAVEIKLKENVFVLRYAGGDIGIDTCTCTGCTNGCNPRYGHDADGFTVWRCSACVGGGSNCTKTVSTGG